MELGYSSDEMYSLFKKYCKKIKYVDARNIFKFIYGIIFKHEILINGFNSGIILEKIIKEACNEKGIYMIRDIRMPIVIPSVDLHTGAIYVFTSQEKRGNFSDEYIYVDDIEIGKAVRQVVIRGVFSPCRYKNTELIGADYLLKIKTPEVSLLDVGQMDSLYQFGYVQTKQKIKEIKNILN